MIDRTSERNGVVRRRDRVVIKCQLVLCGSRRFLLLSFGLCCLSVQIPRKHDTCPRIGIGIDFTKAGMALAKGELRRNSAEPTEECLRRPRRRTGRGLGAKMPRARFIRK